MTLPPEKNPGLPPDRSAGVPPAKEGSTGVPPDPSQSTGSAGVPPAPSQSGGQDARTPFFNPCGNIQTTLHNLPHWHQNGVFCFITWRLADAMPTDKLAQWKAEKEMFLRTHPEPWTEEIEKEYHKHFTDRIDQWLDAGHGSCVLRSPGTRRIVEDAFKFFDGKRYELISFVIMPNHVHTIIRLKRAHALDKVLHSWKSYTSKEINKHLKRHGPLWQEEYWDRLIRSERHLHACLDYIRDNPAKAKLPKGHYTYWEKEGSTGVPHAPS